MANTTDAPENTGMQAFPNEGFNGWGKPEQGMTLRDYFAAKAMAAMLSAYPCQAIDESDGGLHPDYLCLAEDSYEIADAMMEARKNEA